MDSNHRRRTPTGLQPVPFGHLGTLPNAFDPQPRILTLTDPPTSPVSPHTSAAGRRNYGALSICRPNQRQEDQIVRQREPPRQLPSPPQYRHDGCENLLQKMGTCKGKPPRRRARRKERGGGGPLRQAPGQPLATMQKLIVVNAFRNEGQRTNGRRMNPSSPWGTIVSRGQPQFLWWRC